MIVKLIVQKGGKATQAFRLRSEETIIGRRRGCDVGIPSEAVSRRHCLISVRNGGVTVEDLASVNGTFVNGKRLGSKQLLYPGDRLEVGPVTFVIQYTRGEETVKPSTEPEEVEELELVEESDAKPLKITDDDAPEYDVIAEIDEAGGLQLPENEELRDLLAQMDDAKPKKKKK